MTDQGQNLAEMYIQMCSIRNAFSFTERSLVFITKRTAVHCLLLKPCQSYVSRYGVVVYGLCLCMLQLVTDGH